MKKTTVLISFTLLLVLALCGPNGQRAGDRGAGLSLGPACLWAASPEPPQEKKPGWKSREEYDAYQAADAEQDPNKKIAQEHHDTHRKTVELAEKLGVNRVINFSGCPGDGPTATKPGCISKQIFTLRFLANAPSSFQYGITFSFHCQSMISE